MKKVTGQYNQEYVLDTQGGKQDTNGVSYRVQGMDHMWVKLLNDHSKSRQLEIERLIQDGGCDGSCYPTEIVYGRGRFAGYAYYEQSGASETTSIYEEESRHQEEPYHDAQAKKTVDRNGGGSFVNTAVFKIIGAILIGALLCLLNITVLHGIYLRLLSGWFEETILDYCTKLSCYGVLACIGGVALMGICAYFWHDSHGGLFLVLETCSFIIGMIVIDLVLVIIVAAMLWFLQFLKSILPFIISIVFVIIMLKLIIGWLRRLFR